MLTAALTTEIRVLHAAGLDRSAALVAAVDSAAAHLPAPTRAELVAILSRSPAVHATSVPRRAGR